MYESFYGLAGKPFQLNPDPAFFFDSRQHRRAMAFVEYGLHQGEGFIVVTGEVGAGKTTVIRNMLGTLDPERVVAANLVTTQVEADDMLRMVGAAFGIRTRDIAKSDLLLQLEAMFASHASAGRRCLLIVDEAQNLSRRAVEELRMLSNFQLGTHALLQSFLVGQPEFRLILQSPEMNQLRQRVIAACHIGPLDAADTRKYIEHRLGRVGWKDVPLIQPEAFDAIFAASGGIPRRINLLCDRLLLAGFIQDKRVLAADLVKEVAEELVAETVVPESIRALMTAGGDLTPAAATMLAGTKEAQAVTLQATALANGGLAADTQGDPLQSIESSLRNLEATWSRIERGSEETLSTFRRFVEWVRARERRPGDHH
jgi:putative secretion ATPase (PEP-CTERM system associated)